MATTTHEELVERARAAYAVGDYRTAGTLMRQVGDSELVRQWASEQGRGLERDRPSLVVLALAVALYLLAWVLSV